jgi:hypothetical protein
LLYPAPQADGTLRMQERDRRTATALETTMPADKNSPTSKPTTNPQAIRDLPEKKGSTKDEQVKGGRASIDGAQPHL